MYKSIAAAARDIRQGQATPVQLVQHCLEQIDRQEEQVRAWVFVAREDAIAEADRLTAELRQGQYRGPLHGIPLGIKDIMDVFDWPTAAGSQRWNRSSARQDAAIVQKLRQAGAIFLGKTVTTQYASFDPPPTRNPWRLDRTPGGSSSGSAAAVACGMCLAALGSQTGGSITRPASFCGVAGCKPTYGRVSCHGILPLAASIDHPGPIARTVADLALLLQVIAGPDPRDPSTVMQPVPDYTALLNEPCRPPRLGRVRGLFADLAEPPMLKLMEQIERRLSEAGAEIRPLAMPAAFAEVLSRHRIVMAVEAAAYHADRLRRHPDDYRPNIRQLLEEGIRCPAHEYARTREHQRQLKEDMLSCFAAGTVDVLLTPATRGPAPDAATTGDPAFNSPWSYTGLPTVSIPAGWTDDGLPLAIQLVGRPWTEAQLLWAAAWCERAIGLEQKEPNIV